MNTARIHELGKKCEKLKEMWSKLASGACKSINGSRLALWYGEYCDCELDSETTNDIKNKLQYILEAQIHVYEDEIACIVNSSSNKGNKDLKLSS